MEIQVALGFLHIVISIKPFEDHDNILDQGV